MFQGTLQLTEASGSAVLKGEHHRTLHATGHIQVGRKYLELSGAVP